MIVTNRIQRKVRGRSCELVKGFIQIDNNGGTAGKPVFRFGSMEGLSREELKSILMQSFSIRESLALDLIDELESSNGEQPQRARRIDVGAPSLGRPGLPTRPLAAVR